MRFSLHALSELLCAALGRDACETVLLPTFHDKQQHGLKICKVHNIRVSLYEAAQP